MGKRLIRKIRKKNCDRTSIGEMGTEAAAEPTTESLREDDGRESRTQKKSNGEKQNSKKYAEHK